MAFWIENLWTDYVCEDVEKRIFFNIVMIIIINILMLILSKDIVNVAALRYIMYSISRQRF